MNCAVHELAETELDRVSGGGSEMQMIALQSIVSQRQTVLQLTANMLSAMHGATSSVIKNIK